MATIKPLRAFRPAPEWAAQVASLPYDVLSTAEAREYAREHPNSFLHVIKAEIDCDPEIDAHAPEVYAKAAENLRKLIDTDVLIQDQAACLYLYRECFDGKCQTGLVACTPIQEYVDGKIKIHEHTRPAKVEDRRRYIEACGAHTGLIFLTYRPKAQITRLMSAWMTEHAPVYDCTTSDRVRHTVWVIDDGAAQDDFIEAFSGVEALYVADGHHRTEAAAEFARAANQQGDTLTGAEAWNDFLAVLFPSDELTILDYNRVVKDLNGLDEASFLRRIAERFTVERYAGEGPYHPKKQHAFGMYVGGSWYVLRAKAGTFQADDPVEALDAAILQKHLFEPVLGIPDPRTDARIDFVGGVRGVKELERLVDSGTYQAAFAMYPTTIGEVLAVADAGKVMFPKSTWFEPKLRSGLFVHIFEP